MSGEHIGSPDRRRVRPGVGRDRSPGLVACAAAAAVLALAPYERLDALLRFPGQALSTTEAAVGAAVAAWVAALVVARRPPLWRTPATAPAVLFLLVCLVASLAAPLETANALKATGRLAAAALVALLAIDGASTPRRTAAILTAGLASGVVVALVAVLEVGQVPAVLRGLTAFRDGFHVVGGELRASGTLQYPTIASMYLEIAFALGLGLLVLAADRGRRVAAAVVFAALLLVAEGVALTLTRAGVLGLALGTALVLGGLVRRRGLDGAARLVAALGLAAVAAVAVTWASRGAWLRLASESTAGWYQADYDVPAALTMRPGEIRRVPVRVRNAGRVSWRPNTAQPFRLSYHWLSPAGNRVVAFDGLRSELPGRVAPGAWTAVTAWVQAPHRPGRYRLAWDVVQEDRLWLSTEGSPLGVTTVDVAGEADAHGAAAVPEAAFPRPKVIVGRLALWRAALAMVRDRPLTGVGPDNFRLRSASYLGVAHADPRVHSNSMYVEVLAGTGVPGGLVFLWLLWSVAAPLVSAAGTAAGDALALRLGVAAALAAILAHGLVDAFLTFTPTYAAIGVVAGLAVHGGDRRGGWDDADRG